MGLSFNLLKNSFDLVDSKKLALIIFLFKVKIK